MSERMIRFCSIHGETEFALRSGGVWKCLKCEADNIARKRENLKLKAIEYKGGCCSICKYSKCISALEFHHLDPTQKEFGISSKGYTRSWDKVKEELDKCILVCANCHREIHESQRQSNPINSKKVPRQSKISSLDIDLIRNDINSGMKQREIAKKYNVSISTLKRFLTKYKN